MPDMLMRPHEHIWEPQRHRRGRLMTLPATYGFPEASGVALASPPWFFPQFITQPCGDGASHAKVLSYATDVPALWQADTFTADQYSQLTVASSPTGAAQEYVALILRSPLTASAHMPDC